MRQRRIIYQPRVREPQAPVTRGRCTPMNTTPAESDMVDMRAPSGSSMYYSSFLPVTSGLRPLLTGSWPLSAASRPPPVLVGDAGVMRLRRIICQPRVREPQAACASEKRKSLKTPRLRRGDTWRLNEYELRRSDLFISPLRGSPISWHFYPTP